MSDTPQGLDHAHFIDRKTVVLNLVTKTLSFTCATPKCREAVTLPITAYCLANFLDIIKVAPKHTRELGLFIRELPISEDVKQLMSRALHGFTSHVQDYALEQLKELWPTIVETPFSKVAQMFPALATLPSKSRLPARTAPVVPIREKTPEEKLLVEIIKRAPTGACIVASVTLPYPSWRNTLVEPCLVLYIPPEKDILEGNTRKKEVEEFTIDKTDYKVTFVSLRSFFTKLQQGSRTAAYILHADKDQLLSQHKIWDIISVHKYTLPLENLAKLTALISRTVTHLEKNKTTPDILTEKMLNHITSLMFRMNLAANHLDPDLTKDKILVPDTNFTFAAAGVNNPLSTPGELAELLDQAKLEYLTPLEETEHLEVSLPDNLFGKLLRDIYAQYINPESIPAFKVPSDYVTGKLTEYVLKTDAA